MTARTWEGIKSIFPSEFQDALANNCPPRPGVIQTAKSFRENPAAFENVAKKRIEDIEQQIKALQGEKEKLSDKEGACAAVTEACATVCAPIRRIPYDILLEIAYHALGTYPSPSTRHSPVNLSHVSSAWRSVVLRSPNLWVDLYLRVESIDLRSLVKQAKAMNTWFHRAGSLPINLFLYVDWEIEPGTTSAYEFRLLLKAIAPWASRVARLGIGGQFWVNLMTQFVDIEWDLSNLHTLELLGQCTSDEHLIEPDVEELGALASRINLFENAPKITTLIAKQELTRFLSAFIFLPWFRFTSVVLEEHLSHQEHLWKLLRLCPRLESAFLHWIPEGSDLPSQVQPVHIAKLERLTLEVRSWEWNAIPRFFSAFRFLSLTHLDVRVDDILAEPGDEVLTFGVVPSFPSLTTLHLDFGFPISHVIDFLRSAPKLQELALWVSGPATDLDTLFEAMTISDAEHNLTPLLEECFIWVSGGPILLDTSSLSRFICSRAQDVQCDQTGLRKLSLIGNCRFLTDLQEEVARISGATKQTATCKIMPLFDIGSSILERQGRFRHPYSRFADANDFGGYARLIRHESWLE